jgi:hypothetical protein
MTDFTKNELSNKKG